MITNEQVDELEEILSRGRSEREVCKFIKAYPQSLLHGLSFYGQPMYVIPEFQLGTNYRADFAVVAPFSGGFEVKLIEIEPPLSPLFNKDLTMARHLNKAMQQVNSWKTFIEKNNDAVIMELDKRSMREDLVKRHSSSENLKCTAGLPIYHPSIMILFKYSILIGRRKQEPSKLENKASFRKYFDVELVSTDRLVDGLKHYMRITRGCQRIH